MLLVAANHGEAVLAVQVLLGTEFHTLVPDVHLIDRAAGGSLLDPLEQAYQRGSVALHGVAESLDLHIVLDALQVGDGRAEVNLLALQGVGQGVTHAVGVDENDLVLAHTLQEMNNVVIVAHPHTTCFEMLAHLVGNLVLIDEQFPVAA